MRIFLLLTLFLAGCATTGPAVDKAQLQAAHDYYEVKARRHIYTQILRVRTLGEKLLATVPEEERDEKLRPHAGILLDRLNEISGRAFGIPDVSETIWTGGIESFQPDEEREKKKATLIAGVLPGSAAQKAGLRPGDLLLMVNERRAINPKKTASAFLKLEPGDEVTVLIEREGAEFEKRFILGEKPYPVNFNVDDQAEVNAFALPGQIVVTSGMLRFVKSEDELAVVMGHELAHLTEGHYAKRMGTEVVAGTLGTLAGIGLDIIVPGAGRVLSRVTSSATRAPFSREFEREADYVGLRFAHTAGYNIDKGVLFWDRFATELPRSLSRSLFSTHPSSPERLLRLEKTIEELKSGISPAE